MKKSSNFIFVIAAFLLAVFIRTFFIGVYKIPTQSMVPTFLPGDHLLASKITYGLHFPWNEDIWFASKPQRNDIIIFNFKDKSSMTYIKRVTAIEGDEVQLPNGQLAIVPQDEVYVLNDNPDFIDDSREHGFVALKDIEGQARLIWFSSSKESGVRWNRLLTTPTKL
ncbi:MAG: signal peptidase I [Bdellovibrionaceae bacterium]|nr:signal peptidase I [Bdellovibrio sp.]